MKKHPDGRGAALSTTIAVLGLLLGVAGNVAGEEPDPPRRRHAQATVQDSGESFQVQVGGRVDAGNAFSWGSLNEGGTYAVETMRSLTLKNLGTAAVDRPRVAINGRGRGWSPRETAAEITRGVTSPQEKAYLLWYHLSRHRYHWKSELPWSEMADPFRQLRVYGYSLCGRGGQVALEHFAAAGLGPSFLRRMNGHVQGEVVVDGAWQFLDIDERRFVLDRENDKPVSGDELARDHDLNARELFNGPVRSGWEVDRSKTARWGGDDLRRPFYPAADDPGPDFLLRPGEEITFLWSPPGRWYGSKAPLMGSGRISWSPLGAELPVADLAELSRGFSQEDRSPDGSVLVATKDPAVVIFSLDSPWSLIGGALEAELHLEGAEASARWELSFDRKNWSPLVVPEGSHEAVRFDDLFPEAGAKSPIRRRTWLRLHIDRGAGSRLEDLRITHDLIAAPKGLPYLEVGENEVEYLDAGTRGGEERRLEVALQWSEWEDLVPPSPPAKPIAPTDGEEVATTRVPFAWPATRGAAAWHLTVSTRPDFAWPYRPNYDVILEEPRFEVPFRGMFSPDRPYYWRVRARSEEGIWGRWSPSWTFTWQGPRVPRNLRWREAGGRLEIHWEANPAGAEPAAYEVYGSDERGFSLADESGGAPRGEGRLLGRTGETSMVVADGASDHPAMNRAFYRVVPIDHRGVEGPPSKAVELPRPWVYRPPPARARVGEPYVGKLVTLRSLGDLQTRPQQDDGRERQRYWEEEEDFYILLRGPRWLEVAKATGKLSGVPRRGDEGTARVEVLIRLTHPYEVPPGSPAWRRFRIHQPLESIYAFLIEVEPAAGEKASKDP